jgi:hypothetical protein
MFYHIIFHSKIISRNLFPYLQNACQWYIGLFLVFLFYIKSLEEKNLLCIVMQVDLFFYFKYHLVSFKNFKGYFEWNSAKLGPIHIQWIKTHTFNFENEIRPSIYTTTLASWFDEVCHHHDPWYSLSIPHYLSKPWLILIHFPQSGTPSPTSPPCWS